MSTIRFRYLLTIFSVAMLLLVLSVHYLIHQIKESKLVHQIKQTHEPDYSSDVTLDEDRREFENRNYVAAVLAFANKNFNVAIDELNEEISRHPGHAQAYFLLGKIYEDVQFPEGKYFQRAMINYEKYLSLKPDGKRKPYATLRIAQYYVREGLRKQDIDLLDKAEQHLRSLEQSDGSVRMALGAIYLDKKNYERAIAEFEKSANLPPAELKLKYNSLGLAYIKIRSYGKAQNMLEIGVTIDPENKYAHNNLGFVYAQQGRYKEAENHFSEALRIDPTYKNAQKNLEWVRKQLLRQ
jgi:tetratricopeptide (TPR) repeat protein